MKGKRTEWVREKREMGQRGKNERGIGKRKARQLSGKEECRVKYEGSGVGEKGGSRRNKKK